MSSELFDRLGLGPIDQISYVVENIDRALPNYEALFGPFEVSQNELPDCTIRGQAADCTLKMAIAHSGSMEIELIEVIEGETTHTEHLRAHGEGLHHVRFRVDDIDAKLPELEAEGFETLLYKRFSPKIAFAYLQTPDAIGGSVIELLQL
jgi:catechol 2,3-dioxygenase-like lactoylglutathione lyase family enzyme